MTEWGIASSLTVILSRRATRAVSKDLREAPQHELQKRGPVGDTHRPRAFSGWPDTVLTGPCCRADRNASLTCFAVSYMDVDDQDGVAVTHGVGLLEEKGVALSFPPSRDIRDSAIAMRESRVQSAARPLRVFYKFGPSTPLAAQVLRRDAPQDASPARLTGLSQSSTSAKSSSPAGFIRWSAPSNNFNVFGSFAFS